MESRRTIPTWRFVCAWVAHCDIRICYAESTRPKTAEDCASAASVQRGSRWECNRVNRLPKPFARRPQPCRNHCSAASSRLEQPNLAPKRRSRERKPTSLPGVATLWMRPIRRSKLRFASSSIIVRMSAIRKLAAVAADSGLLASELAAGISRVKSAKSTGVRAGNWLSLRQAQALLSAPDNRSAQAVIGDRAYREITSWGRFQVVQDRKQADLILLLTSRSEVRGQAGKVDEDGYLQNSALVSRYSGVTVLDAKTGDSL